MSEPGPPASADSVLARAEAAAAALRRLGGPTPRLALILGSGLGSLADSIEAVARVPFSAIPHLPTPSVAGHSGEILLGRLEGMPLVALRGRLHTYEGYSPAEVAFPVRVVRRLGAEIVIVTNAAGGLDPAYRPGDLMLIADHINLPGLAGLNPLRGPHDSALGERFVDLLDAYDPALRALARAEAARLGIVLHEGIYVYVAGPTYETRAETRALRLLGGDAVGMSTVPEVLVARQERLRVLALSCITNVCAGPYAPGALSHGEVLGQGAVAGPRLAALLRGIVAQLAAGALP